ncbi:unnamed protein product, partial [Discosporangium mesarthrocarpum]
MEAGGGGLKAKATEKAVPAGGLPKRLAAVMSYCRVSTRATCEVLVSMGWVVVNGEVMTDPQAKVDITKDRIVCNGE